MTEIQKIKQRKMSELLSPKKVGAGKIYSDMLVPAENIPGTYMFADIDYSDRTKASWKPAAHLGRLISELVNGGSEKIKNDGQWREKMLGALKFWLANDFFCDNWWYNQIGTPNSVLNIALILDDYLSDGMKAQIENIAVRGSFKARLILGIENFDFPSNSTPDVWGAANFTWAATTSINHALWTEDDTLLRICVDLIGKELCYSGKWRVNGILPDGSYVQHGVRWYSGGYGRAFVCEMAPIINLLGGTSFAVPEEKIDILLHHILEGQRFMQRNGYFDFNAIAREHSRKNLLKTEVLSSAIKLLAETEGIKRKEELSELYSAITRGEDNIEGTVYYDTIAQLCHKKNGVYVGIRGRKEGILGSEHCNKEGVLCYNLSYGTITCFMESGREYLNISPVWDFAKIPGTVARKETDEELLAKEGWSETLATDCRAFGKADGDFGILSERAVHDGISLNASYFTFNGSLVALGSDITDERGEALHLTVEQCFADEAPVIEKNLVRRGRIFYKNLDNTTEFISSYEMRTGSWHRNNLNLSEDPVSEEVLTITVPVKTGDSYAYVIYPDSEPDVTVLKNDRDCQAILVGNKLMASFLNDSSLTVGKVNILGAAGEIIIKDIV